MNKEIKKLLTVFLSAAVVCSFSSVAAFADDAAAPTTGEGAQTEQPATEGVQIAANKVDGIMLAPVAAVIKDDVLTLEMKSTAMEKVFIGTAEEAEEAPAKAIAVSEDGKHFAIPMKQLEDGKILQWSFFSKKNQKWYTHNGTLNLEAKTLTFSKYVNVSTFTSMTLEEAKASIDSFNSAQIVSDLIEKIYVQTRNSKTDQMCELAKYAWDKADDEIKATVEEVSEHGDYFSAETGDASKDDVRNTAPDKKKELLVVSFGTSFNDSRANDIGGIEKALEKQFGNDYSVRRAFTAQIIINHVQSRENMYINNVKQAMDKAVEAGVEELVVQPTHLMHGAEYDELKEEIDKYADKIAKITYAEPLLGPVGEAGDVVNSDKKAVTEIISKEAAKDAGMEESALSADSDTAFVFMGHGTAHAAKVSYTQMQAQAAKLGYKNVFIGTVEGEPEETSVESIIETLKANGYRTVILRPLMVVAGDHANNDMAGDEDDSWKSAMEAAGFEVETQIEGLGSIEGIQKLYVEHSAKVIAKNDPTGAVVSEALDKAEKNVVEAEKAAAEAQKELAEVKAEADATKAELTTAKKDAEDAKAELAKAKTELAKLKTKTTAVSGVKAKANKKGHTVKVSWKKSSNFDSYKVYRAVKGGKYKVVVKSTKSASATIKGQKKGKTYSFKVVGSKKIAGKTIVGKSSKVVKVKAK